MISLSDTNSDQFEPIAVSSFESFDKEYSNRTEETKPDFYRFKALFEKSEFGKRKFDEFKALYDDNQEKEETVFQPLLDLEKESASQDQSGKSDKSKENSQDSRNSETSVEKDIEKSENMLEEKGYRQGFEKSQTKRTIQVREDAVEILNLLEQTLKTPVPAEEVVLSVSQDDYEYIEMIKDEFFETVDSLTSISVRSDPSLKRGICKIETITASISSDVESRLEAVFEATKTTGAE